MMPNSPRPMITVAMLPLRNEEIRNRRVFISGSLREPSYLDTLCERASADAGFVRELEDYGLLEPRIEDGENRYPERDVEVVIVCRKLFRFGVAPRNLKRFRTNTDGEAALLRQVVAPALGSSNPERRLAGLEDLETLAALAQELSQALFWRALRSHLA